MHFDLAIFNLIFQKIKVPWFHNIHVFRKPFNVLSFYFIGSMSFSLLTLLSAEELTTAQKLFMYAFRMGQLIRCCSYKYIYKHIYKKKGDEQCWCSDSDVQNNSFPSLPLTFLQIFQFSLLLKLHYFQWFLIAFTNPKSFFKSYVSALTNS